MERLNQRQGFLVSAIVHLVILMALANGPVGAPNSEKAVRPEALPPGEQTQRVFLPPAEVLRRLLPRPLAPAQRAVPTPPPPADPAKKDKISIGGPSSERAKGPLELRRDQDVTAPKGRPDAVPSPPPATAPAQTREANQAGATPARPGTEGLNLPPSNGTVPRGNEGSRPRPGAPGSTEPSIASSLRNLERRLQESGPLGLPTGVGQQMGPLFFDPQGADFTLWINHFKNEVYRNWIVPQPAILGIGGHVDLEFTVERDGQMTNLKMLKSSGTAALDRAAENALRGSRLLPLPADFGPPRVTMQVSFIYGSAHS